MILSCNDFQLCESFTSAQETHILIPTLRMPVPVMSGDLGTSRMSSAKSPSSRMAGKKLWDMSDLPLTFARLGRQRIPEMLPSGNCGICRAIFEMPLRHSMPISRASGGLIISQQHLPPPWPSRSHCLLFPTHYLNCCWSYFMQLWSWLFLS